MDDALTSFLRACARSTLDEEDRTRVAHAAARVADWSGLPHAAEYHGLTPLVWEYAHAAGLDMSAAAWRQLAPVVLRRRAYGREQAEALGEIVDALDAAGIVHVVLKGAALAHILYPRPDLRPMGDLDILVAPAEAPRAQDVLRSVGFHAPSVHEDRARRFHHHLPIATRERQGIVVNVEIHRDALSGTEPARLRLDGRIGPTREFRVNGRRLRAFGHEDMLTHLCAHALGPGDPIRLIKIADFVGYATRYAGEIDWDALRRRRPRVVNALALMHYVTPLPESLAGLRPLAGVRVPADAGRGLVLPGAVITGGRSRRRTLRVLLAPPEWWLRAYYGVPAGRPLAHVRWSRHPGRLLYWFGRRLAARLIPAGRWGSERTDA